MSTRARIIVWALAVIVLGAVAAALLRRPPPPEPDSLNVPLGVEQAAIITWSGAPITVAPYKWGVAVNARIAGVTEESRVRIYDVRYIVNRGGTFDLKDYLVAAEGSRVESLPSFKFQGDPKLSKELETRIQETEETPVDVGGHYYATLAALAVFWIVWLLLLIFYKRPKRQRAAAPLPPEPTFAAQLRATLDRLEGGTLSAEEKARLEMLLLRRWREVLALPEQPMHATLESIGGHARTAHPLRQLQLWLHHRASPVGNAEIAAALAPFAAAEGSGQP